MRRFPRLYAAASLKHPGVRPRLHLRAPFSAALCRGLIEARERVPSCACLLRFPRLYAAASLKRSMPRPSTHPRGGGAGVPFSAALCRGLIEAVRLYDSRDAAALCRGLIEARPCAAPTSRVFRSSAHALVTARFPRLYAAASLKRYYGVMPRPHCNYSGEARSFSAALCRGLIEAGLTGFPRLYAAASLMVLDAAAYTGTVFRGFMPRPH